MSNDDFSDDLDRRLTTQIIQFYTYLPLRVVTVIQLAMRPFAQLLLPMFLPMVARVSCYYR